jgi:hypothetical protein
MWWDHALSRPKVELYGDVPHAQHVVFSTGSNAAEARTVQVLQPGQEAGGEQPALPPDANARALSQTQLRANAHTTGKGASAAPAAEERGAHIVEGDEGTGDFFVEGAAVVEGAAERGVGLEEQLGLEAGASDVKTGRGEGASVVDGALPWQHGRRPRGGTGCPGGGTTRRSSILPPETESLSDLQPTSLNPLYHGGPASRHGRLNSVFQGNQSWHHPSGVHGGRGDHPNAQDLIPV